MAITFQAALLSFESPGKFSVLVKPLSCSSALPLSRKSCKPSPRFHITLRFDPFASQWSTTPKNSKTQLFSLDYSDVICSSLKSDTQSGEVEMEIPSNELSRVLRKIPGPVREFPWKRAIEILAKLLSDIVWSTAKWLLIPVILLSSLSEISYALVQNKELLIPMGMLAGNFTVAAWSRTVSKLSEDLQKGEVPWHLIAIGLFLAFIKFPGPSYPYWGRIFLPHFATGGLLRTYFLARSWENSVKQKDKHNRA